LLLSWCLPKVPVAWSAAEGVFWVIRMPLQ